MKLSRVAVLGVAAARRPDRHGARAQSDRARPAPSPEPPKQVDLNTEKVLVATQDVSMGTTLTAGDVAWRDWPKDSVSGQFITGGSARCRSRRRRRHRPRQLLRRRADQRRQADPLRSRLHVGDPARGQARRRHQDRRRYQRRRLHPAQRSRRRHHDPPRRPEPDAGAGGPEYITETILNNVRVLAIDQTIEKIEQEGRRRRQRHGRRPDRDARADAGAGARSSPSPSR